MKPPLRMLVRVIAPKNKKTLFPSPRLYLEALKRCPHLQAVRIRLYPGQAASMRELVQELLQSPNLSQVDLHLSSQEQLLVVADELQQGRSRKLKYLSLSIGNMSEKGGQELSKAIEHDQCLQNLTLRVGAGYTDDFGVAVSRALAVNTTLEAVILSDRWPTPMHKSSMGVQGFQALSAMLRVNTRLQLTNPAPPAGLVMMSTTATGNIHGDSPEAIQGAFDQMCIEKRLNTAHRGKLLLASNQTTRAAWVAALAQLVASSKHISTATPPQAALDGSSNLLQEVDRALDCAYQMLHLNPLVCRND